MAVTLRDIARKLDISHVTVSLVLNDRRDVQITDETRERVLNMAKQLGYRPNHAARALALGATQMIALWMPSPAKLYYGKVFDTLYGLTRAIGYETVFCLADYFDGSRKPYDWPVDGIIAVDTHELLGRSELPKGMPVVTLGAHPDIRTDSVSVNILEGARMATSHLLDVGCRRIAHVTTERPLAERRGRASAYRARLRAEGLKPEMILCPPGGQAHVRTAVVEYLQNFGVPDGLFCYSDEFAFATMRALADLGLRPGIDVRVIGFDDVPEAQYSNPSLSSVAQPVEEMCRKGIQLLVNRIQNPKRVRRHAKISMTLAARESTLAGNASAL